MHMAEHAAHHSFSVAKEVAPQLMAADVAYQQAKFVGDYARANQVAAQEATLLKQFTGAQQNMAKMAKIEKGLHVGAVAMAGAAGYLGGREKGWDRYDAHAPNPLLSPRSSAAGTRPSRAVLPPAWLPP